MKCKHIFIFSNNTKLVFILRSDRPKCVLLEAYLLFMRGVKLLANGPDYTQGLDDDLIIMCFL